MVGNGSKRTPGLVSTWCSQTPGREKSTHLEQALNLVAWGGIYLIDDLSPQVGWPEGHEDSVKRLFAELEGRDDFHCVRLAWSSGLLMAVRSQAAGRRAGDSDREGVAEI
ncbi:hypothetical protein OG474_00830 [Kribbella sp. NBC_01505]|uniref:hypothetical protein n=1 Tax=Kribbella sp. NBC_01505 TaxID=2903580 RepID=UPI00386FE77F